MRLKSILRSILFSLKPSSLQEVVRRQAELCRKYAADRSPETLELLAQLLKDQARKDTRDHCTSQANFLLHLPGGQRLQCQHSWHWKCFP